MSCRKIENGVDSVEDTSDKVERSYSANKKNDMNSDDLEKLKNEKKTNSNNVCFFFVIFDGSILCVNIQVEKLENLEELDESAKQYNVENG